MPIVAVFPLLRAEGLWTNVDFSTALTPRSILRRRQALATAPLVL